MQGSSSQQPSAISSNSGSSQRPFKLQKLLFWFSSRFSGFRCVPVLVLFVCSVKVVSCSLPLQGKLPAAGCGSQVQDLQGFSYLPKKLLYLQCIGSNKYTQPSLEYHGCFLQTHKSRRLTARGDSSPSARALFLILPHKVGKTSSS